ncbi:MAG: ABC transporter ATP-binding protein [Elusimicrobiota bacterium]
MKTISIIKKLFRFVKPYQKEFILALSSLAMVSALTPSLLTMIKPVMDGIFSLEKQVTIPIAGIVVPRANLINYLALVITCLAVLRGLFEYISKYMMAYIGQNVTKDLRNRIFRHLMYLSLSYYMSNPTGQLLSRITNDVKFLEDSVVKIPSRLIRDGLQLIFLVFLLFYFNWQWAIFSIVGFLFIILPFAKFSKILRKIGMRGHQKMADIYDFLAEKISGVRLIKAFSMEKEEQRCMREVNQKFIDVILKSEKIDAIQGPFIELLSTFGIVGIIVLGGHAVIEGNSTPGDFFVFMGLLAGMYMPAKNFAGINQQLQRALAAAERIFTVLEHKEHILQDENPEILTSVKENIVFNNVCFAYEKENYVLNDMNFSIRRGDIIAFVGPSGAGKTTLVNLVPRFFDPQKGNITIDGININKYTIKSLRHKVAMVMQDIILFNVSVRENICYGLGNFTEEDVEKYAQAANAHDFIKELPYGYDTIVGERGVKLSGGRKQRISIARALIKNPEILILDEATSHLDTESEKLVQEAMDNLIKGRTTLIIAHRLSTVRKADKIVVMDGGRIVEQGRHEELLAITGLYRKMFEMQSL